MQLSLTVALLYSVRVRTGRTGTQVLVQYGVLVWATVHVRVLVATQVLSTAVLSTVLVKYDYTVLVLYKYTCTSTSVRVRTLRVPLLV